MKQKTTMNDDYIKNNKHRKHIPVWKLVTIDLLVVGLSLCAFSLFHHVLPSVSKTTGINIIVDNDGAKPTFNLPSKTADTLTPGLDTLEPTNTPGKNETTKPTNKPTSEPQELLPYELTKKYNTSPYERTVYLLNTYKNSDSEIYINKVEIGEGQQKITYYTADVFVASIQEVKTAFATGQYGRNLRENILEIAENNNAILAISGDFYANNDVGVVIRNGYFYRSNVIDQDVCVMFTDGTIRTYAPSEFNKDEVLEKGAWQAWTFGPALLDNNGNKLGYFNCSSYIKEKHPRCSIGFVSPGHYVLTVVDGRDNGYSRGVNLNDLAQIMIDEGCKSAYNLDGGKTAVMVFNGMYVNSPVDGGRTISDIIYINR